jgi:hypothetical protein
LLAANTLIAMPRSMIIGRSSGLWKTGGTPLSLTFVREGQFVADGNGLMGTQVAKPSRGTVGLRELLGAKDRGPTADRRPQEEYVTVVAVAVDGS